MQEEKYIKKELSEYSCSDCGSDVANDAKVCPKCGADLNEISEIPTSEVLPIFSGLSPYYQEEFQRIYKSNEEYKGKWNWVAFFFPWIWAFSKGAWGYALLILISVPLSIVTGGIVGLIVGIIMGLKGNIIYYNVFKKKFPINVAEAA